MTENKIKISSIIKCGFGKAVILITYICLVYSCEIDSDIELHQHKTAVVSALAYKDSSLVVNVYGTTAYTDSIDYTTFNGIGIEAYVNGKKRSRSYINSGLTTANLGNLGLQDGDTLKLEIWDSEENGKAYSGESIMLSPAEIIALDTTTLNKGDEKILRMRMQLEDPSQSNDYYQVEVRVRKNGKIIPIKCNYSDYLFYIANSTFMPYDQPGQGLGMFTDEQFNGKRRRISFSVKWEDIYKATGYFPIDTSQAINIEDMDAKLEIVLYRHTAEYYNYMRTAYIAQGYLILPVFGIPSIYSNVTNGEGIISCMSKSAYNINLNFITEDQNIKTETE